MNGKKINKLKKPVKYYKEEQKINVDLFEVENFQILKCYEHFKTRLDERLSNNFGSTGFNFKNYVNEWVKYLRGDFAYIFYKNNRLVMIRSIGNYIKDSRVFKIVYIKIENLGIYVPLTIIEIEGHKKKFRLAQAVLKNKQNNMN